MQFAQPDGLWSLLVLVPMLLGYLWWWRWKTQLMERLGDRSLLREMAANQSARRQIARATFILLGTALLCVAYAQPQWGQTNRPIKRTGVDVVFALDLSSSMSARDVAPNRLEAAKNEIETTLEVLRGDRVGLVVFTAVSFVQTPLTTDYGAIRFYLGKLQPGQMPLGGTSLGRAVLDGVELLTGKRLQEDSDEDVEMRRAKNQVIVLITDGEDHESDPRAAAQLASSNDIKIVTVGFGSADGERIPVYRADGTLSGFKRDRAGEIVKTRLDEETLVQMSSSTGGTFIKYAGENSVANALVEYINALEKTEIETMLKERYRERFTFFALPGLLLLIISMLFGERRPRKKASSLVTVLFGVLLIAGCDRPFEDTLDSVDEGNAYIEKGLYQEALDAFRRAETEIPARPELHFDIGRAQLGLEQYQEAADSFARALETDDISLRFDALDNLGLAHSGQQAWRSAWETFRDALVLAGRNPGIVDDARLAETRHNLEVAWRRLYPPCVKLEDDKEDNDEPGAATTLEQPKLEKASLCGLDDDWYVVQAIPGSTVTVTANFKDLREEPLEDQPFLRQPADLQIALFNQEGTTAVAVDQGEEPPSGRKTTRQIVRFHVDETMVGGESPHLLLKIGAAEHLEFEYDLEIQSIPPCHALEEALEDNDSPDQAKIVNPGNHTMHHCGADEDWFILEADPGDSIFIDLQTSPDAERERPAELTIELFDANERLVAEGEQDGAYLTLGVRDVSEPSKFLLRVSGQTSDEQGPYQLDHYRYAPCAEGDDRFEENDTANAASPLDPSQPVQRYLRACAQDPDFFRIDFKEDDDERKVEVGLARVSTPPPGADPTELPPFRFDLMSPSGDQILVPGIEPTVPDPSDAEAPKIPISLLVQTEKVEEDSAFLRVLGEDEFYHLVQLNVQNQDQQQDDQDQQPDEGQDQPSESEQQKDGEDQESESQEQDDGGEEEEEKPAPGEESEENPDDKKDGKPSSPQQEAEMGRLEDILEALEQTDDNFQMRKALENMPGRYIEKDW